MSKSGFTGQGNDWEEFLLGQAAGKEGPAKKNHFADQAKGINAPKKRDDPEHREAVALMRLVHLHEGRYPALRWFYHQDNGRATRAQNGRKKAEGTRAGVSDYFLPFAGLHGVSARPFHGLFLELKAPGEKPSPIQLEFLQAMRARGYAAEWRDSAAGAWKIIESYLNHTYTPSSL